MKDGSKANKVMNLSVTGHVGELGLQITNMDSGTPVTLSGNGLKYNGVYEGVQRTPLKVWVVSEEDGINVFLVAGGEPCPRGIEIPTACFANGDIIMQHYKLKYNINTKINGNGTVTAKQTVADSGEEVTFTVEPKEGYVLDEVKVTDANGNVVVFTDYTFTMPSADVTIEATFIKEVDNSETSDSTIMMFIATMSILIFIAANYKRKVLE